MAENEEQPEVKGLEYLTSPKKFHLEMPPYLSFDLSIGEVAKAVYKNLNYSKTIDAYCIYCEKESVFDAVSYFYDNATIPNWTSRNDGLIVIRYRCSRDEIMSMLLTTIKLGLIS